MRERAIMERFTTPILVLPYYNPGPIMKTNTSTIRGLTMRDAGSKVLIRFAAP